LLAAKLAIKDLVDLFQVLLDLLFLPDLLLLLSLFFKQR